MKYKLIHTISMTAAMYCAAVATAQTDAAASAGRSVMLEEVVVTAQRREESLQKAAMAIAVASEDQLLRAQVTDATQLTAVAPSLQVGTVAGSANAFYMRGVGNFTTNSLSDAAVSFNVDGVPYARSQAAHGVFYDMARIEVLKGPQGTLYGRNATGGAINVITAKPVLGESSGFARLEAGNYSALKFTGAVNVPVGENGAIRLSGHVNERDGYYSDGTGDEDTSAVRLQYKGDLSDRVSLSTGFDYTTQDNKGPGATIVGLDRDERIGVIDPRAGTVYESTYVFLAGNTLHALPDDPFNDNQFWGVRAELDVDTSMGTLTLLPSYRKTEIDQRSYAPGFDYRTQMDSKQSSLEMRLASDSDGQLNYLLGLFYMKEDTNEYPIYNQQYFLGGTAFISDTTSYAAFGRLYYDISDDLRLTLGARYTVDDKKVLIDSTTNAVVCPASLAGTGACPGTPALPESIYPDGVYAPSFPGFGSTTGGALIPVQPWGSSGAIISSNRNILTPQEKFKEPTYRVAMEYDIVDDSMVYASVETGFKAGGFFATIDDPTFDPETITAYTLGSKNRFLDNSLELNVELFYWAYEDQQVSHLSSNTLGGVEFITENAGKTDIKGAEVEASVSVAQGTILRGMVQYLDAEYKDFTYDHPVAAGFPTTACPISGPVGGFLTVDCTGKAAPNAPKWTVTAGIEHRFGLGSGEIVLNLDGRYQSEAHTGFELLPQQLQDGYAIVNAQVSYEMPETGLTLAAFVNNLADESAASFTLPNPRAGSALVVESLNPPRTYGVRLNYDF